MVSAEICGAEQGALFPYFRQGLAFWSCLEQGGEVVAENACEDHYDSDGEEDPVAADIVVSCREEDGETWKRTREQGHDGSAVPLVQPL